MKAGIKTTEFWLVVLANIILLVGGLEKFISPDVYAVAMVVLNSIYTAWRTLAKVPDITTLSKK